MVDAADHEKLEASRNELHGLLEKPQLAGIPVCAWKYFNVKNFCACKLQLYVIYSSQSMCMNSFENKLYIIIIITVVQAIDHYCNQYNINLKVCPEMHANEIHTLHDWHHKVSPSPNPHLMQGHSVKREVILKLQTAVCNMKYPRSKLCAFLDKRVTEVGLQKRSQKMHFNCLIFAERSVTMFNLVGVSSWKQKGPPKCTRWKRTGGETVSSKLIAFPFNHPCVRICISHDMRLFCCFNLKVQCLFT